MWDGMWFTRASAFAISMDMILEEFSPLASGSGPEVQVPIGPII